MTLIGNAVLYVSFNGEDSSLGDSNIAIPGLKAGDILIQVCLTGSPSSATSSIFDPVISSDGYLKQFAGQNLSGQTFHAVFVRSIS